MKTGLVLEGGAKRGIYTAGVLDVFLEHEIFVDGVIGVSAGAIHGCSYISLQKERSIRYNIEYGNDYRFMSLKSLFLTGNIVDTKFCYHDLPEKLDPFDNDTFKKSSTKFYVTCSNVETGLPEYVYCDDLFKDIDYLRASASMPFVSKIVKVGNKKLLDGGIADSIPLKGFINLGYEKNIVIQTQVEGYFKKKSSMSFFANIIYRKYPKFVKAIMNRYLGYNKTLKYIKEMEDSGKAFVLKPSRKIKISKMEQNLDIVKEMYELGRSDALDKIDEIKEFLK